MKPLILITNDDGIAAKGLLTLSQVAREFGDVIVMAPDRNASGLSHSISINVLYSGTMGAAIEAVALCIPSIGFSLLNHSPQADFEPGIPFIRQIIRTTLDNRPPAGVTLNVNIPRLPKGEILGIRICHEANACWNDSFEKRIDPQGRPYWWLTGKFVCDDPSEDSDEWALAHGYVSIVPIHCDFTHYPTIDKLKKLYE